jgi:hypothetical protein
VEIIGPLERCVPTQEVAYVLRYLTRTREHEVALTPDINFGG